MSLSVTFMQEMLAIGATHILQRNLKTCSHFGFQARIDILAFGAWFHVSLAFLHSGSDRLGSVVLPSLNFTN